MAELKNSDHAHIFILKLWQEVLEEEQSEKQIEWRGKIQDVFNGETHYFRDWPTIVKFISNILPELGSHKRHYTKRRLNGNSNGTANGKKPAAAALRRRPTR